MLFRPSWHPIRFKYLARSDFGTRAWLNCSVLLLNWRVGVQFEWGWTQSETFENTGSSRLHITDPTTEIIWYVQALAFWRWIDSMKTTPHYLNTRYHYTAINRYRNNGTKPLHQTAANTIFLYMDGIIKPTTCFQDGPWFAPNIVGTPSFNITIRSERQGRKHNVTHRLEIEPNVLPNKQGWHLYC